MSYNNLKGNDMKLTKEQIEALRALSVELADKLEAGESVTLEPPPKVWEPQSGAFSVGGDGKVFDGVANEQYREHGNERQTREAAERLARDQRIFNRLHAYREEFAPGYVVPPVGQMACFVWKGESEWELASDVSYHLPTAIYMPEAVCQDLCDKLNSGEVVL